MGLFTYNSTLKVDFEDRLLAHLQTVIAAKLRRHEPFLFSWTKPEDEGGGRTAVWIDAHIPMAFEYVSTEAPSISRRWLEALVATTYNPTGLQVVPDSETDPDSGSLQDQSVHIGAGGKKR